MVINGADSGSCELGSIGYNVQYWRNFSHLLLVLSYRIRTLLCGFLLMEGFSTGNY